MVPTIKTSLTIPKTLCDQADTLAKSLHISRNQLFKIAIETLISDYESDYENAKPAQRGEAQALINQGDVYWVHTDAPSESESGIRHPHVVIQENVLNHSRITTVVACALTSNIKRSSLPGNVLLDVGEANLIRQSVVEVSKVTTLEKVQLGEYIGSLTEPHIEQIMAGMRFLQRSFFAR